jgi:protein-disulfide isomerase
VPAPADGERDRGRRERERREAADDAATLRRDRLRLLLAGSGAVVLLVVLVAAFGAFKGDPTEGGSETDVGGVRVRGATETAALLRGLPQDGVTLGRKDAPVTILEIADLKCPSCQEHELRVQPQVVDRLVRTGRANLQMQLVNYRDDAAGTTDGEGARRAAYGFAARDRFWNFVHATYWNQGPEQDQWATEARLREVATAAPGIEPAQVDVRETPATRTATATADRLAAALRTDGTPSVYVIPRGSSTGEEVADSGSVDAIARAVEAAERVAR